MAQTPWTGLLTGSSTPFLASGDIVAFVDISDTTQSASGSLVKGTLTQYFAAIPVPIVVTSASANALAVGLTGATNSAFTVDASTALQVAGLKVTGAVTGGTVAVVTTDSGAATNLTINAKGTGTIGIGSVSTGRVTITPVTTITGSLTLSAALVYGGVTLSNAVTGTENMVLSASPTFTGTAAFAAITATTGLFEPSGVENPVRIGVISTTYGAISFNDSFSDTAGLVIQGGGTGDSNMYLRVPTGGSVKVVTNNTIDIVMNAGAISGVTTLNCSAGITATTGTFGTTPATAGIIRIPNAQAISARNAANGANVTLISLGSDDILYFATGGYSSVFGGPITATTGTFTGLIKTTVTTQQLALHYDASNHLAVTVASNGAVTYDATGAGAGHTFSEQVTASRFITASQGSSRNMFVYGAGGTESLEFGLKTTWTGSGITEGNVIYSTNSGAYPLVLSGSAYYLESAGTTASAANVFIDTTTGQLLRSTSSLRYKTEVRDLSLGEAWNIVDGARAIAFREKGAPDRGEHVGLAAERMAEVDDRLITRDADGRPDWVQYSHITAPLAMALADVKRRMTNAGLWQ